MRLFLLVNIFIFSTLGLSAQYNGIESINSTKQCEELLDSLLEIDGYIALHNILDSMDLSIQRFTDLKIRNCIVGYVKTDFNNDGEVDLLVSAKVYKNVIRNFFIVFSESKGFDLFHIYPNSFGIREQVFVSCIDSITSYRYLECDTTLVLNNLELISGVGVVDKGISKEISQWRFDSICVNISNKWGVINSVKIDLSSDTLSKESGVFKRIIMHALSNKVDDFKKCYSILSRERHYEYLIYHDNGLLCTLSLTPWSSSQSLRLFNSYFRFR